MMPNEEPKSFQDDRALWKRMRRGDEQALAELFRRHYASLFDYGLKLSQHAELVRDGIQEIFAYIWEKRQNLAAADSIRAYLLVSLRRHLLKLLQQVNRREASDREFQWEQAAAYFSPEELFIAKEKEQATQRVLNQALEEIPPRQREALYLKTFDGLSYREIAAIMNVSPQVARNYVCEAFHKLRGLLVAKM
jgi:RNA polymerase sigma factor (sigma-70 family)